MTHEPMTWPFGSLSPLRYGAILADPPWAFETHSEKGQAKGPEAHYVTMSAAEIAALPVDHLAGPDCYLFLWATWPHLEIALDVMRSWGFAYVTGGSWTKRTRHWNVAMGTGYVLRSATEPFLVGRLGRPRVADRGRRNVILAPSEVPDSIEAVRREHSRKPPEMRALVEALVPDQPRCELFAREPWPGAEVWGNQVDRFR